MDAHPHVVYPDRDETNTRGAVLLRTTLLFAVSGLAVFGLVAMPASSRELQVTGRAGYLSEWRIEARVPDGSDGNPDGRDGPVRMIHTGLCSVSGPVEKAGQMSLRVSGAGPLATVEVDMRLPDATCRYRGRFSRQMSGAMDCSDAKGIPVELTVE